jgi:hypothetical protein
MVESITAKAMKEPFRRKAKAGAVKNHRKRTASSCKKSLTDTAEIKPLTAMQPRNGLVRFTQDVRQTMIAMAAYYLAEKRGFVPGSEVQDWLEAEKEVSALVHEE